MTTVKRVILNCEHKPLVNLPVLYWFGVGYARFVYFKFTFS